MDLKLTQINVKHKIFILGSENLKGKSVDECQFFDEDGVQLEVLGHYSHGREDVFPGALYHLLTGSELNEKQFWKRFRKSETVILFICQ